MLIIQENIIGLTIVFLGVVLIVFLHLVEKIADHYKAKNKDKGQH
jgi:hypothetical protein